jgi:hypothetical protein
MKSLFKKPTTVDDALAGVYAAIENLEAIAKQKNEEQAELHERIIELEAERDAAYDECTRANGLAKKFKDFIQ